MSTHRETRLIDVVDLIETWQIRREPLAKKGGFSQDGLREFVETMNGITRRVMGLVDAKDPAFWSAWMEVGQQASTIAHNAKTIADKIDRSNL